MRSRMLSLPFVGAVGLVLFGCGGRNASFATSGGTSSQNNRTASQETSMPVAISADATAADEMSSQDEDQSALPPTAITGAYLTCATDPTKTSGPSGDAQANCGFAVDGDAGTKFVGLSTFRIDAELLSKDSQYVKDLEVVKESDDISFSIAVPADSSDYYVEVRVHDKDGSEVHSAMTSIEDKQDGQWDDDHDGDHKHRNYEFSSNSSHGSDGRR